MDYAARLRRVLERANQASQAILSEDENRRLVGKGFFGDTSYKFDILLEEVVVQSLLEEFPGAAIISEEAGIKPASGSDIMAIVDPLDGSTNASRGLPFYSTAVALASGKRFMDIFAAGIADLVNGEIILGVKGKGVRSAGRTCEPAPTGDLSRALIGIDPFTTARDTALGLDAHEVLRRVGYARFMGSSALETCYVAIGRLDAFLQLRRRLRSVDCFGPLFLVSEAGAFVHPFGWSLHDAELTSLDRFSYLAASNIELGTKILRLLGAREGR